MVGMDIVRKLLEFRSDLRVACDAVRRDPERGQRMLTDRIASLDRFITRIEREARWEGSR